MKRRRRKAEKEKQPERETEKGERMLKGQERKTDIRLTEKGK